MENKICIQCEKPIHGRADKKFCDDYCRNAYNNHFKRGSNNLIRNISNALRKNRNILESLLIESEETIRVPRERLLASGFIFKYHTHTYTNKRGDIYNYCFDFGYLALDNDWYLIVKKKERQQNKN
ncbi:hypothetical protein JKA74_00435 [Marivirga sp. S37H4]|uniref:DUF2116 family Zn-ribbon domain-containing protein n=1 Tax=Marivirga aurantiaca TaxID=2802615 RepID=A0A934WUZ1_9BACT|nr:hypothetical protein [Marivirga aurantiaca]MBK6263483.1 hypothetical protein [Marivirga aurantiaca]